MQWFFDLFDKDKQEPLPPPASDDEKMREARARLQAVEARDVRLRLLFLESRLFQPFEKDERE